MPGIQPQCRACHLCREYLLSSKQYRGSFFDDLSSWVGECRASSSDLIGRVPAMIVPGRWQKLYSCLSLAAFLLANSPRLIEQPLHSHQQQANNPLSCCCYCTEGADSDACCRRAARQDLAAFESPSTANEDRPPTCPCCPCCPTGCCHVCQVKSPCCLAVNVASPGTPSSLERLTLEASQFLPPGPCDDLMHPPRA
jgi:hypothetical protein